MFAKSYCPSRIPQILPLWERALKQKGLPFAPENILETEELKAVMQQAFSIEQVLVGKYYSQPKQSAEEYMNLKEEYN